MRSSIFVVFILFIFLQPAMAANTGQLLTWGYVNFPPYHYDNNGKVQGAIADQINAIFKSTNLEYSAVELPAKRARLYIEEGRVDFSTVIETFMTHSNKFLKSDLPIYRIRLGAICQKDSLSISNIADLREFELIIIAGYSYGLEDKIDVKSGYDVVLSAQHHKQAINALIHNRGDCFLGYEGPYLSEKEKLPSHSMTFYLIEEFPVYLYLNKRHDNAERVMRIINNALLANN
ncbi:MAG: transporter substrate-binding domain-containing protein [Gammaproteobacteria bacterium]|nr:transporter substrate-binding domain-containing protein [Gammaproteobacteria bacterium]